MAITLQVVPRVANEVRIKELYNQFGPRKLMGQGSQDPRKPHYFLHRTFFGEQDLLIIFNTKRCRYQCHFCQLPAKSSRVLIPEDDIVAQFEYVMGEMKHSLSILNRLTFSNEGSVLDGDTFPQDALLTIARCVHELRLIRTLVLETRLEFVEPAFLSRIVAAAP